VLLRGKLLELDLRVGFPATVIPSLAPEMLKDRLVQAPSLTGSQGHATL